MRVDKAAQHDSVFCTCLLKAGTPLQAPAGAWYGDPENLKAHKRVVAD
jgi:hypothetical protein